MVSVNTGSCRIVGSIILALGLSSIAGAQEVDTKNPEAVKAYRESFHVGALKNCMQQAQASASAAGQSFDQAQQVASVKLCECIIQGMSALVPDAEVTKLKTVAVDPALQPQRQQIVAGCLKAAKAGTGTE